jgi:hypothetical protein
MNLALALLLCGPIAAEAAPADTLDFRSGSLAGWEGEGFAITTGTGRAPSAVPGVSSSDRGTEGRTAVLHRTLTVPSRGGVLRFRGHATLAKDYTGGPDLDVILFSAGKKLLPKKVRTADGWKEVPHLLTAYKGRPREYMWDLSRHAGQTLRLALVDDDKRPGCHILASGFRFQAGDEFESQDFEDFMVRIAREHRLPPVAWYESPRFKALSNADDDFSKLRLCNCELLYDLFLDHFRRKGFGLYEPSSKLAVAVFDNQAGFSAYIGQEMPAAVTGLYHPKSNRLVVYDFGQNELFVAQKKAMMALGRNIRTDLERRRFLETVQRQAQEFRTGTNISTVMHEVAHQLSFNTGLLNRDGDVPVWLAEGLACYCEPTEGSVWQGIGEFNSERAATLADPRAGLGKRIALLDLLQDDWLRGKNGAKLALLGYAQSWALFRMLMEERPEQLGAYLAMVYQRKAENGRIDDFGRAFGDLNRLELRYVQYIKEQVEFYRPSRK